MTDYRKAVELADGWGVNGDDEKWGYGPFQFDFQIDPPDRPHVGMQQWHKDSLAAQLLRQYRKSALESGHVVRWINFSRDYRRVPLDQDLTDFTINAILESGILENK